MIADLTLPLEDEMQLYPGLSRFESQRSVSDETGAVTRQFTSSTHQGTHVDAPAHYVDGPTVDEIPLDCWRGPARVIDLRGHCGEEIGANTLSEVAPDLESGDRVLLLTGDVDNRFGEEDFFEEAAVLTTDGAEWLVEREVSLVANDFLTESLDNPARPVHHTLLEAGIPIVEYLCNAESIVDASTVEFMCFPLHLVGFEASPVRAVACLD